MRALLQQYASTLDELRATGVVRSKNNPVADYAEWLAACALKLTLCTKSTKGYDGFDALGRKFEIKARRLTADNGSRRLSAIRGLKTQQFDWLVGILFSHDFSVVRAAQIPWEVVVRLSGYSRHTNAGIFYLRNQVWAEPGVRDITNAIQAAEVQVCGPVKDTSAPQ